MAPIFFQLKNPYLPTHTYIERATVVPFNSLAVLSFFPHLWNYYKKKTTLTKAISALIIRAEWNKYSPDMFCIQFNVKHASNAIEYTFNAILIE